MDLLPAPVKHLIDSIFAPPVSFLTLALDYLGRVSLVAGKGISLDNYFGFFSYLPASLRAVVDSLLAGIILLALLMMIKAIIRLYYAVKDAVQWW